MSRIEGNMYNEINLLNCKVKHETLGEGTVVQHSDTYVRVCFASGEKQFQYPKAFEKYLQCEDDTIQSKILTLIVEMKQIEEKKLIERQKKLEEETKKQEAFREKRPVIIKRTTDKKENIAFKCNYCDGGQNSKCIGYKCACADGLIKYNIEVAKHSWCCSQDSPCKQYHDGIIDRVSLDSYSAEGGFVCYESQMLRNWTAFAGFVLTGERKQKPMKLSKVQVNSLAILTTREPFKPEAERIVFGVFLVDEAYEGDNRDEGYVTTSSKYKICLSKEEANKIHFWKYYHNERAPEKIAWGQGLHRYISDFQAASILKDIADIKRGTEDEELAREFLEYFCKINSIDVMTLPFLDGALLLQQK